MFGRASRVSWILFARLTINRYQFYLPIPVWFGAEVPYPLQRGGNIPLLKFRVRGNLLGLPSTVSKYHSDKSSHHQVCFATPRIHLCGNLNKSNLIFPGGFLNALTPIGHAASGGSLFQAPTNLLQNNFMCAFNPELHCHIFASLTCTLPLITCLDISSGHIPSKTSQCLQGFVHITPESALFLYIQN